MLDRRSLNLIEESFCAECGKKIFRIPDFTGRTLAWNHKSTGNPVSYSPDTHHAKLPFRVEQHEHTWIPDDYYLICEVEFCGARKMTQTVQERIAERFTNTDKESESRKRGGYAGSAALRETRAKEKAQKNAEVTE